jgi:hypothetical protein
MGWLTYALEGLAAGTGQRKVEAARSGATSFSEKTEEGAIYPQLFSWKRPRAPSR